MYEIIGGSNEKIKVLLTIVLSVCALLAFGCGDTENDNPNGITKEEAAQKQGKGDTENDLCELMGWYEDGECDEFCVLPDPDCEGCASDLDCSEGQECVDGSCQESAEFCGGFAGATCAAGEFCSYASDANCGRADQSGTCEPRPEACGELYAPVCGCDGQTYGNACTANASGVSVASQGECT